MDLAVRSIEPADVPAVVAMVHELATYERAADDCHLTGEQLTGALFGPAPALHGYVAVPRSPDDAEPVGVALWFLNFSTWRGTHGIYLEDLYVRPSVRGSGAGRALLAELAATCVRRGYHRLEWSVLDWNPARDFYHAIGAGPVDGWVPYRLTGEPLHALAAQAHPRVGEA